MRLVRYRSRSTSGPPIALGAPGLIGPLNIALDGHSLQQSIDFRLAALRPGTDVVTGHPLGNATAAQLLARFDAEIHSTWDPTRMNVVILDVGLIEINDDGLTAAQTYTSVSSYIAHATGTRGWLVLPSTIIHTLEFPGLQAERDAYNTLRRAGGADGFRLADIATVPELSNAANTTYFDNDGIHLVGPGQDAKALKYHQVLAA